MTTPMQCGRTRCSDRGRRRGSCRWRFDPWNGRAAEASYCAPGRGKSGGARVITLYLGEEFPVYAIFLYAKNEREDLSPAQTKTLLRLVTTIKEHAKAKR